jgi:hypothetical protein
MAFWRNNYEIFMVYSNQLVTGIVLDVGTRLHIEEQGF